MADDDETERPDIGQDQFTALRPLAHTGEGLSAASVPIADPVRDAETASRVRKLRVSPYSRAEDDQGADSGQS